MKSVVFETESYGAIEITRDPIKGTFVAYFHRQDYETNINSEGEFKDLFGVSFRVMWHTEVGVLLEVLEWKDLGCKTPKSSGENIDVYV